MLKHVRTLIITTVFCSPLVISLQTLRSTKEQAARRSTSLAVGAPSEIETRSAPSEVVGLFDEFAASFEENLIDDLKYTAPRDVAEAAAKRIQDDENVRRNGRLYSSAIDAGCGTGLIGPYLRKIVDGPIVGVDLSPKMAELAAELVLDDGPTLMGKNQMRRSDETARKAQGTKRLYDGIFTGDLLDLGNAKFLDGYGHDMRIFPKQPVDLIVCADVLCYFGDLKDVLQEFSDRLCSGGDLVFTTETMSQGDYNWVQLVSSRYAHSPEYVHKMALECGLSKVSQVAFSPRYELGEKVLGTLHTFTKQ
jgi:predicted TPR repeat methyltransferase